MQMFRPVAFSIWVDVATSSLDPLKQNQIDDISMHEHEATMKNGRKHPGMRIYLLSWSVNYSPLFKIMMHMFNVLLAS